MNERIYGPIQTRLLRLAEATRARVKPPGVTIFLLDEVRYTRLLNEMQPIYRVCHEPLCEAGYENLILDWPIGYAFVVCDMEASS